jgi:hypothetical protein
MTAMIFNPNGLQNKAIAVANEIMNIFNKDDPSSIKKCRQVAEEVFGEGWEEKGAGIYDGQCVFYSLFIQWFEIVVLVVVILTLPGCGLTESHNKRSPAPGRHKLI